MIIIIICLPFCRSGLTHEKVNLDRQPAPCMAVPSIPSSRCGSNGVYSLCK